MENPYYQQLRAISEEQQVEGNVQIADASNVAEIAVAFRNSESIDAPPRR